MKRAISVIMAVVVLLTPLLSNAEGMLKLPSGLTRIEAEAFAGNASLTVADIPYGTESIASRAFADSVLEKIYIPRTVSFIAEDAFEGTDVLISSPSFSYAQTYAEAHGFAWEDCGDHYPLNVMDTASDILDQEFQIEDEELVGSELLSTEGETAPERLQLIEEYNALVLEENELIAACNDTSALISAMEEMGGMLDSFSFEETAGGVGFSLALGQLVLDNSLYNHLQAGYSITNAELSQDGTQVILTAGSKKYILYFNGDTLSLSAANGANAKSVITLSRSERSFAERVFAELETRLEIINSGMDAINYYIALQLEHFKGVLEASDKLHKMKWKLGILPEGVYDEQFEKILSKIKNFKKLDVLVSGLSIPAQIASGYVLIRNWRELEAIDDHNHPTENDLSEEARRTSEKLKKEIVSLRGLYVTDAINTMIGLSTSVATILSLSTTIALSPAVEALCEKLAAGTALSKLLSFGIGLVLAGSENIKWKTVKELDSSLHTTVSGKVYDASTKLPLQYVSVVCGGENVWTDSTGAYTIYLQPGTHTITFKRDGYQDHKLTVTVKSGDKLEGKNVELKAKEVTLTGVIRDSETGDPLSSVTILCGDRMELSNTDGRYSISLPIGPQTITFMLDGYQDQAISLMLEEDISPVQDVRLEKKEPDPTPTPTPTPEPTSEPEFPETPASSFTYTISNGEVTITGFIGNEQDVVIPKKIEGYPVTTIGDWAFMRNITPATVLIQDGVTTIGNGAFYGCYSLRNVWISDSVTNMGNYTFEDCSSLIGLMIPGSVTNIGNRTFFGCSNLTSVIIQDGVMTIGYEAFRNCSSLTNVSVPDSMTTIGYDAFSGCSSLMSVTLGNNVSTIGDRAFQGCSSLIDMMIPNNVTSIGSSTFMDCTSLVFVTLGNSVTTIGRYAFYGCKSLGSIMIPDNVTTIGDLAFYECRNLTSITIPRSVTSIGNYALEYYIVTVYCYEFSFAHTYCVNNDINFSLIAE